MLNPNQPQLMMDGIEGEQDRDSGDIEDNDGSLNDSGLLGGGNIGDVDGIKNGDENEDEDDQEDNLN